MTKYNRMIFAKNKPSLPFKLTVAVLAIWVLSAVMKAWA